MKVRNLSYATYRRNPVFWLSRQERGEEIRLLQLGRVVGVLCGAPYPVETSRNPTPRQRLHRMTAL